jgi:hypothetical protein
MSQAEVQKQGFDHEAMAATLQATRARKSLWSQIEQSKAMEKFANSNLDPVMRI